MKITDIESLALRFEYDEGFRYAGGRCTARVTNLVRVHTDTGAVGLGAAYSHPGLVHLVIQDQLAPMLLNRDPTRVEELWDFMYRLTRWYGRKGAALSALGALDTAFWDLRAQAASQPLWRLLGGANHCPAYASALLWRDPAELADEARDLVNRGFTRVKMRLGRDPDYDRAAVEAVRGAVGPDIDIMADGSMRYDATTARATARLLEEHGCFWFEEPFEPENHVAFATLRAEAGLPLAAGENEFGTPGFRELVDAGAVDIVQPDASRCGGITEVLQVSGLAHEAGLRVATHSWSDAVAIIANAHVIAAQPNGITVEIDQTGNPFVENLLREPLRVNAGQLQLGDQPGLGIELDDAVVDRYRMDNPLDIPPGSYSDMVFGPEHWAPAEPYRGTT